LKKIALTIIAFLMLLSACGNKTTPTPTPTAEPTPAPTPINSLSPSISPYINPLTGLPSDKIISRNRPYAIMVNDLKEALPQCGVGSADIIYEVVAEGGITRMVAVFQDVGDVGAIGSVRSTRTYYLDIAQGLDAILLHAGASTYAYEAFNTRDISHVDGIYNTTLFYRDSNRMSEGFEHSLFTSGELITENIGKTGLRLTHDEDYACNMAFGDPSSLSGTPAESLSVEYSYYKTGEFRYSNEDKLYYIRQFDEPYVDGDTDDQVAVKNVLVLFAGHSSIPNDDLKRIEVDLVGTGSGIYAAEGRSVEIEWTKGSYDSQFEYTLKDGSPLVFAPGTSYINIVESSEKATIE